MSPHDIQAALPEATPPQFYPVQFHPEFGYLAPTMHFRRKMSLVAKGVVFGVIAGAIAAIALWPDRGARVRSVFNMPTQAVAGDGPALAPVRFVAPTLALQAVRRAPVGAAAPQPVVDPSPAIAAAPAAPTVQKAAPKPKKKVARQPQRERNASAAEPDPRNAHAGPFRRYAEPQRDWNERRPFGFGW